MSRYFIVLGLFIGESEKLSAQANVIQLDRPDQTECPFIVPANYIQIENGFTYENTRTGVRHYAHPSTLYKYGFNGKTELRLISEFVTEKENADRVTGIVPLTIGFKTNIFQEKGIFPLTSFLGHLTIPKTGYTKFQTTYLAPSFRFAMQHTLSEKISLAYNLGAEWSGEEAEETYIYSITSGMTLSTKLGGFVEVYGFAPRDHKAAHNIDFGFTYLLNNDYILDLSGGFGLTGNAIRNFVSAGISFRFNTKHKE